MKYAHKTFWVLCGLSFFLCASETTEKDYEFFRHGTYYSFRARFIVNATFDCLLTIIYEFDHIRNYAAGAESLKMIQQGGNWYDVTYTLRKFLFENQSTWRRTLLRDQGKVIFKMISTQNNLKMMPEPLYSEGYYHITGVKAGHMIEYFQECKLGPGLLNDTYINQAKKGAIQFLHEFKDYIKKTCASNAIQ